MYSNIDRRRADDVAGTYISATGGCVLQSRRGAVNSAQIMIGKVVDGKYRIVSELGSGAMGAVYIATHTGTASRVALMRGDDTRDGGAATLSLAIAVGGWRTLALGNGFGLWGPACWASR